MTQFRILLTQFRNNAGNSTDHTYLLALVVSSKLVKVKEFIDQYSTIYFALVSKG